MKTESELTRIALSGASLVLDSKKYTESELARIARQLTPNAKLVLKNADSKTESELARIAANAKSGQVVFDFFA